MFFVIIVLVRSALIAETLALLTPIRHEKQIWRLCVEDAPTYYVYFEKDLFLKAINEAQFCPDFVAPHLPSA